MLLKNDGGLLPLDPASETKSVSFTLSPSTLAVWNVAMKRVVEPGKYEVQIGAASDDIKLRAPLEIQSTF